MRQSTIRWDEVRSRLQKSEASLRDSLSDSPKRMKSVFRQRAIQLAKRRAEEKPASETIPVLIFRLAKERYAIAMKDLAEVVAFKGCIEVPGGPPHVLGVINLRGELRPVLDLARIISRSTSTDSGAVLILQRPAALKVDEIEDLREIRSDELGRPNQGEYIRAFLSGTLALLDVEAMLSAVLVQKESRLI